MKELPIIMSAESVQAILSNKKTQTRRVVAPQPHAGVRNDVFVPGGLVDGHGRAMRAPYSVGDQLWVREKHTYGDTDGESFVTVYYAADDSSQACPCGMDTAEYASLWIERCEDSGDGGDNWRSPIYMPRWASRITLEVQSIRVERVQDISEDGAIAEGYSAGESGIHDSDGNLIFDSGGCAMWTAIGAYSSAWDDLNAKRGYSWESNPWVWVIEFRRVKP